jgi:hypothetical protein
MTNRRSTRTFQPLFRRKKDKPAKGVRLYLATC